MSETLWWKKPLRVIQTNLQVRDTPLMVPEKIARETAEMAGNVLVVNAGGIYAWYQSRVKYHHINEYLPKDRDILRELIDECHKLGIKVVARFDFSKTDDYVYQEQPRWFVRKPDRAPLAYGVERPGGWSVLYSTCINAGYRNEAVAVPAIEEVIDNYAVDGIFFNAPHYEYCCCDACKAKYREIYGKPLPVGGGKVDEDSSFTSATIPAELEPDFASRCVRDNMELIYGAVKRKALDMPLILYYNLYKDNLYDRVATADMICTEPQDVLSLGYKEIPQFWKPALAVRMGRSLGGDFPAPFGIIHSCPGMDWRHTGLPVPEYMFWMSQVPANGGQIWHSITGFNDTVSDKRIIQAVSDINHMIARTEPYMDGAVSASRTLLVWNGSASAEGLAEGMLNTQVLFDVLAAYQLSAERLSGYETVIVPGDFDFTEELVALFTAYAEQGGHLIIEGISPEKLAPVTGLLGIENSLSDSEVLKASYWRFEDGCGALQSGFESTPLLAHRGVVAYCTPLEGVHTLATLVPPFAPLNAVGAPPERASILTPQTDLPLCTLNTVGKGKVLFLPFQLGWLAQTFKLYEHYRLIKNCIALLSEEPPVFSMDIVSGIQAMVYRKDKTLLVHLVNGIGQRPLASTVPYHGLTFSVALQPGERVKAVTPVISGESRVSAAVEGNRLTCTLDKLDVWEMLVIEKE